MSNSLKQTAAPDFFIKDDEGKLWGFRHSVIEPHDAVGGRYKYKPDARRHAALSVASEKEPTAEIDFSKVIPQVLNPKLRRVRLYQNIDKIKTKVNNALVFLGKWSPSSIWARHLANKEKTFRADLKKAVRITRP